MKQISEEEAAAFEVPSSVDGVSAGKQKLSLGEWQLDANAFLPAEHVTFTQPVEGQPVVKLMFQIEGHTYEHLASITPEHLARLERMFAEADNEPV